MAALPREVLKWLQSLDLSSPVRNTKWDFSNGYLIAEIFSWYYPQDIQMHSFSNGTALQIKTENWRLLRKFFTKQNVEISQKLMEATIHCKEGAGRLIVMRTYEILTNKCLQYAKSSDFTDKEYQNKLPLHARSTASTAVKSNLRSSECIQYPSIDVGQQKAEAIIKTHSELKQHAKDIFPARYKVPRSVRSPLCHGKSAPILDDSEEAKTPTSAVMTCSSSDVLIQTLKHSDFNTYYRNCC